MIIGGIDNRVGFGFGDIAVINFDIHDLIPSGRGNRAPT
jgi:hypothetical protein